jgi:hypothetical protein
MARARLRVNDPNGALRRLLHWRPLLLCLGLFAEGRGTVSEAVTCLVRKQARMFVLTEKIAPIRPPQVFDDNATSDAAIRAKRDEDERWIRRMIEAMAGRLRRIRN